MKYNKNLADDSEEQEDREDYGEDGQQIVYQKPTHGAQVAILYEKVLRIIIFLI